MTTLDYRAAAATDSVFELAEGIVWDDRASLVRWIDIWEGRVLSGELDGARIVVRSDIRVGQSVGAVALADDGGLLVAAARGLATISIDGVVEVGPDLLGDRPGTRFNDGSVDPQGRFVAGTLSFTGKSAVDLGAEQLLRVSADGTVEVLRDEIGLSNGIAFSPDGGVIYHVDTFARSVSSHSYGAGAFDRAEPWVTLLDASHLPSFPDGLTVDSTGALWVAQWGGSSVRRYAPRGELLGIVAVDAAQVSCPGFVSRDLDRLAITTAREGLDELTDQAGAIFLADVGVTGLPVNRWAGSTTLPYWVAQAVI